MSFFLPSPEHRIFEKDHSNSKDLITLQIVLEMEAESSESQRTMVYLSQGTGEFHAGRESQLIFQGF